MTTPDHFDFDTITDRRQTDSLKWQNPSGRDILPMWVADMDFQSPPCVLDALRERVAHGVFGYPVATPGVEQAVVSWARRQYGWTIDPRWLVWLPGLVPGIHVACRALAETDDEVLVLVPAYPPFLSAPSMTGRQLRPVPLAQEDGRWTIDLDAVGRAITPRTRLLVFCHPHNPVGRAYHPDELRGIAELCLQHGLLICSDEIHCDLRLEPGRHVPLATLGDAVAERTVTLMSPAKTFNLPGLSCGFAVISDPHVRRRYRTAGRDLVPHPNVLAYAACRAAYDEGDSWRLALIDYLRGNRDYLTSFLADRLPMFTTSTVEATYLAWLDTSWLGSRNTAEFFEQAGVRLSDGRLFQGEGFMRLNFGCPRATLSEALERIAAAVQRVQ